MNRATIKIEVTYSAPLDELSRQALLDRFHRMLAVDSLTAFREKEVFDIEVEVELGYE